VTTHGAAEAPLDGVLVPSAARRAAIERWFGALRPGMTVALSTHINADGDGCGSETALARLLAQRDIRVRIVNPTPWPAMYGFLLGADIEERSADGPAALDDIDALVVVDINDIRRLGTLADRVRHLTVPISVIDHHVPGDEPAGAMQVADTAACATGELIYDVATTLGLTVTPAIAEGLYAAILTDTGSFRYSNTSPRAHAVAAALLAAGVDPEVMYRRIYAQVSVGKLHLLREALGTLVSEPDVGLSYVSIAAGALERYGVNTEDLDGLVEHPRSIANTRMALFFRDLGHGRVKISFRSTGDVDVQRFAKRYDGGGHAKASGAMITGSLESVREEVVVAARAYLRGGSAD
jgi:phosphoesterase RecJ-like protein